MFTKIESFIKENIDNKFKPTLIKENYKNQSEAAINRANELGFNFSKDRKEFSAYTYTVPVDLPSMSHIIFKLYKVSATKWKITLTPEYTISKNTGVSTEVGINLISFHINA